MLFACLRAEIFFNLKEKKTWRIVRKTSTSRYSVVHAAWSLCVVINVVQILRISF